MNNILLTPPIAFLVYLVVVGLISRFGRALAGAPHTTATKSSTYSSGEAPPTNLAAPGYRPFFVVALFFAILHLGALMLGTNNFSPMALVYLIGLMLALLALIIG